MWNDLASIDPRFVYQGERTRYIAFPLGGVGSGGFSVSGSGRLVDWSIRNRPALQTFNGYSHFAIKAERNGELLDARVAVLVGVEARLDEAQGEGGEGEHLAAPPDGLGLQLRQRHDRVDEPHLERLPRVVLAAQQPDLLRLLRADQVAQHGRPEAAVPRARAETPARGENDTRSHPPLSPRP